MRRTILFVSLIPVLVAGCAHSVNVRLRPEFGAYVYSNNKLSSIKPIIKFGQGGFVDNRPIVGLLASIKRGVLTYDFYEERPIDEVIFEGLKTLIISSGHQWVTTEESEIRVDLQLLNVHANYWTGFVTVGATSSVQIELDFVDPAANRLVYKQIYTGIDEREQALVGSMSMVIESINASIIDCINNVGEDEGLALALTTFKTQRHQNG